MSLGAVGQIWKGTATTAFGEGARRPAEIAFGAAQMAAAGASMVAATGAPGGAWSALDMADPAGAAARSGLAELKGSARRYGERPDAISRLAGQAEGKLPTSGWEDVGGWVTAAALVLPSWSTGPANGKDKPGAAGGREDPIDAWTRSVYEAKTKGYGQQQAEAEGRDLLGEKLSRLARESMERRSQAETSAALKAAEAVTQDQAGLFDAQGRLKQEAVQAVRERMGDQAKAFQGHQGTADLAVLAAVAAHPQKTVEPGLFRQAAATAAPGVGEQAPGRTVPQAVGLDPAAAGAHFSAMNRFTRTSEQAGLTVEQRQQLLQEAHSDKGVSAELRRSVEVSLRKQQSQGQAAGLRVEDIIANAEAMPPTLQGPMAVQLPGDKTAPPSPSARPAAVGIAVPAGEVTTVLPGQTAQATPAPKSAPVATASASGRPGQTISPAGRSVSFEDPLAPKS